MKKTKEVAAACIENDNHKSKCFALTYEEHA